MVKRNLMNGADREVEKMESTAAMLGIDLIELLYITPTKGPCPSGAQINGYNMPIINSAGVSMFDESSEVNTRWIDGTLNFYPDVEGYCWGYIYDDKEGRNKHLLATSLSSGWFRIMDKKIREEIIKYAEDNGIETSVTHKTTVNVKKTTAERNAEARAANLEAELKNLKLKLLEKEKEFENTIAKKEQAVARRMRGKVVDEIDPNSDLEK